jgi:predicted nuclease of predicted toxin-antitoxin system
VRIKLDENMPYAMTELLAEAGHDVDTVAGEGLGGADDTVVSRAATGEDRILLTFDLGFGNVRSYPPGSHAGVVVFRFRDQRWAVLEGPARRLLASQTLESMAGGVAIVDETRIRLRRGRREEP